MMASPPDLPPSQVNIPVLTYLLLHYALISDTLTLDDRRDIINIATNM